MMFDFGKRNLINMNYTRYLALPKAWIDAMRLEKGDQVNIEMDNEHRLILSPVKKENPAADGVPGSSAAAAGGQHTPEGVSCA